MKNTHLCPKCNSGDIIRLTDHVHGALITNVGLFTPTVYAALYLCSDCGYMEQWVEDPRDRERLRKRDQPF